MAPTSCSPVRHATPWAASPCGRGRTHVSRGHVSGGCHVIERHVSRGCHVIERHASLGRALRRHPRQLRDGRDMRMRAIAGLADRELLDLVFQKFNVAFLLPWPLMILAPGWKVTERLMESWLPWIAFAAAHLAVVALDVRVDAAAGLDAAQRAQYLFTEAVASPDAMASMFAGASGGPYAAQDWLHLCTWDLFGARWAYLDGRARRVWTSHTVLLCFSLGPAGILSHLLTRGVASALGNELALAGPDGMARARVAAADAKEKVTAAE